MKYALMAESLLNNNSHLLIIKCIERSIVLPLSLEIHLS